MGSAIAPRSFVSVSPESHFPIENLPFGVFRRPGVAQPRIGTAIGEFILDLAALDERGLLNVPALEAGFFRGQTTLNEFMSRGRLAWREARAAVGRLLSVDEPVLRDNSVLREQTLVPIGQAKMLLPARIENYTDFYSSRDHATNVGTMLRGAENALQPNWLHLPVAYHGRASSIVVSGTDFHRPRGQTKADDAPEPSFGPCRNLDFELEMGFFIGPGNDLGEPITAASAAEHIFGLALVNDWSARDIQKWEYQPLGPFLSKNFATSISPWVVMLDALEPFRIPGAVQEPAPLSYLRTSGDWAFDIQLEVYLQTSKMTRRERISLSNAKHLYWNMAQQLAHHTIGGCNLRPGDLLASGTISGPTPDSYGSLLELAWRGTRPLQLSTGEVRSFLQDGDRVTLTGWCQGPGYRVGFGEVTGTVLPARS